MYEYKAKVVRVVDGDTIDAVVDLGFGIMNGNEGAPVRFRLAGIDAPETRLGPATDEAAKAEGLRAKAWLAARVEGQWVTLQTQKDEKGKYGRYLAVIVLNSVDVNAEMISLGLAIPY